jgi:hypothetical protein
VKYVQDHSTLDGAQARALISCLKRKLGLIQGSRSWSRAWLVYVTHSMGPNLPLVASLFASKTLIIVRIGSQSKSERLEKFNLQSVAKDTTRTKMEKKERARVCPLDMGLETSNGDFPFQVKGTKIALT